MTSSEIRRVAVIGTGTIGASWAAFFLSRGLAVAASDPAPAAEDFVRRFVAAAWPALVSLGGAETIPEHRLSFHAQPEDAVAEAEFVQENAPEREALKQQLLHRIDAVLPPSVIIASSSSGLLMSDLQRDCRHPQRCVIGHPFNPPHLVPLVEVVAGAQPALAAVERALTIYAALGKRPIRIRREVKGHVANRLQAALWREAVHLLAEGVASVADQRGTGLALGADGPASYFPSRWRHRRNQPFPRSVRRPHGRLVARSRPSRAEHRGKGEDRFRRPGRDCRPRHSGVGGGAGAV